MRSRRSQWGGLTELQLLWLQELESAGKDRSNREAQTPRWLKISHKKLLMHSKWQHSKAA